eukprot:TRINITY_DN92709_c0_g1_i1.p1 TRINITY_DN92709_c0_g1~~TRINITY_DN92709_c0_g1_i1.p1  ORF type:complete len:1546 (+),score=368.48 TRINITY_DN92709_c0_g1_i1:42-4640(+)
MLKNGNQPQGGSAAATKPQALQNGNQKTDNNWEFLTRTEIYRQRVLGTESGASHFIEVDDQRKLNALSMVIYCVFIYSAMSFVWGTGIVQKQSLVNNAVKSWIDTRWFKLDPEPRYLKDVSTLDDLKQWLIYGFPSATQPAVHHNNFPLSGFRFTLRRVQSAINEEPRFRSLTPITWKDKNGIESISDRSTQDDSKDMFGYHRIFAFNINAEEINVSDWQPDEGNPNAQGVQWCTKDYTTCRGDLLDRIYIPKMSRQVKIAQCSSMCEGMFKKGKICHCWTLTPQGCNFYYVEQDAMTSTAPVPDGTCRWNQTSATLYPPLIPSSSTSFFPLAQRFTHSDTRDGYKKSSGYILNLRNFEQHVMDEEWKQTDAEAILAGSVRPKRHLFDELLFKQVRDIVAGGFIDYFASVFVVDFVCWNPYFEAFGWVQLEFKMSSSGLVSASSRVSSIILTEEELTAAADNENAMLWSDFGMWDGIYIFLVLYYFVSEIRALHGAGMKYFTSNGQLLSAACVAVHISTIALRFNAQSSAKFTKMLAQGIDGIGYNEVISTFENQAVAWQNFIAVASTMMVFLWSYFVRFLADIFPRIAVLVNTVNRSLTPVFFLVIILANVFLGFVIWCNLWFGSRVEDFNDIASSAVACTEMIFGRMSVMQSLRREFPISGFTFYVLFMIFFFYILNYLSRAIVYLSFHDASRSYEKNKERIAAESGRSNDVLTKAWRKFLYALSKLLGLKGGKERRNQDKVTMPPYGLDREVAESKAGIFFFAIFAIIYAILISVQLPSRDGFLLASSIISAIETTTFSSVSAGHSQEDRSFNDVKSRDDSMAWLSQALPKALFESSPGTLEGGENFLKSYHANSEYKQIVINDWNILLGQTPVRMSLKYDKLKQVPPMSASSRMPVPSVIRAPDGDPDYAVTHTEEIWHPNSRTALEKYCGGEVTATYGARDKSNKNGFACMLSVDQASTVEMLKDMERHGIVNNQTREMALDFVAYNGNYDMFLYVAIEFQFMKAGNIEKNIKVGVISLPSLSPQRFILEVLVMLFTVFYLALGLAGIYRAVLKMFRKGQMAAFGIPQRLLLILQVIFLQVCGNPFNLLEMLSTIMTLVTMSVWYSILSMPLTQGFFLPETPEWTTSQCDTIDICKDTDVLFHFAAAADLVRFFGQLVTVNTVILFYRSLKYLEAFEHIRVIFNTIIRGAKDICCFMIVMCILLMGYVTMGHTIFGPGLKGFSSVPFATITCFQMFLGTFTDFEAMRDSSGVEYFFYWYTYMVLFRYVLINMFFAIIANHFFYEDYLMIERHKERHAAAQHEESPEKVDEKPGLIARLRAQIAKTHLFKLLRKDNSVAEMDSVESVADAGQDDEDSEPDPSKLAIGISFSSGQSSMSEASGLPSDSMDDITVINADTVKKEENWKYLPPDMQEWALDTARNLCGFIEERCELRKEMKEEYDIDHVLQETEDDVKDRRKKTWEMAERVKTELEHNELRSLKEIHQDQESLAWYIMKREAELQKLEETKGLKQDRFDKTMQAAKSLVDA